MRNRATEGIPCKGLGDLVTYRALIILAIAGENAHGSPDISAARRKEDIFTICRSESEFFARESPMRGSYCVGAMSILPFIIDISP